MSGYDSIFFSPPAPVAIVTLVNPENGLRQPDVPMLLDTGADITLVSKFSIEKLKLNLAIAREFELAGFDDHKTISRAVRLKVILPARRFEASSR